MLNLVNINRMWSYNERDSDQFSVGQNQETGERSKVSDPDQKIDDDDREQRENEIVENSNDDLYE